MDGILEPFGFKSEFLCQEANLGENYIGRNVVTVLGYFPLAGLIVGIARIAFSYKKMQTDQSADGHAFYAIQITRGVFEIVGLGLLFLIPDLVVTAIRAINAHNASSFGW